MPVSGRLDAVMMRLVDARPLAVTRVVVAATALLKVAAIAGTLLRLAEPGWLRLSVVSWLPYPSTGAAVALLAVWTLAALGLLVGWRTRVCGSLLTVCLAVPLMLDEQLYSNHLYLLALLTLLLTVADSGARWSLDAGRRGPADWCPPGLWCLFGRWFRSSTALPLSRRSTSSICPVAS